LDLYYFRKAAITNHHKLGGFKEQKSIVTILKVKRLE
jgi:hypothetical protein